jgi:hypothetical protein
MEESMKEISYLKMMPWASFEFLVEKFWRKDDSWFPSFSRNEEMNKNVWKKEGNE